MKVSKFLPRWLVKMLISLRLRLNRVRGRIIYLPHIFVSVTDRCNSNCSLCGIWKGPGDELEPAVIDELVAGFKKYRLRNVIITGGEPLMRDDLSDILDRLSGRGMRLFLCTNGILLRRRREEVLKYFDSVIVSLDSHDPSSYKTLRGVDAFDEIVSGISSIKEGGMRVVIAHTLQKVNILHLAEFIAFAKGLGVDAVSVRPLDAYSMGFGSEHGQLPVRKTLLPSEEDLVEFSNVLEQVDEQFSEELASGFITPDIKGLWKIRDYFLAKTGDSFPKMRCNAPFHSCVIESNGDVKHCFFAEPFANINRMSVADIKRFLNSDRARKARKAFNDTDICIRCAFPHIRL